MEPYLLPVLGAFSLFLQTLLALKKLLISPPGWCKRAVCTLWNLRTDPTSQAVSQKLNQTRQRVGHIMRTLTLIFFSIALLTIDREMALSSQVLLVTVQLELILLVHAPRQTVLFSELIFVCVAATFTAYECLERDAAPPPLRLLLATCQFHPLSVLAWNLASAACLALLGQEWSADMVKMELLASVAFFLVASSCFLWMLECSKREVASALLQHERSAALSLLGMTCDVVVQLDDQLRLVQDAPQLAATLFRRPDTAKKGSNFMQFLREEDAANLRQMLMSSVTKGGPGTGCNRTVFSDGMRTSIKADLFYVSLRPLEGESEACYIIGIRESNEMKLAAELKVPGAMQMSLKRSRTGPARVLNRNGTAAQLEAHELTVPELHPIPDSPRSTIRSPRGEEVLRFPQLRRTSVEAMTFDLMCLLADWNVVLPAGSCCATHVSILHARKVMKHLEKGTCPKNFDPEPTGGQCQRCGHLESDLDQEEVKEFECPVCGVRDYRLCSDHVQLQKLESMDTLGQPKNRTSALTSLDSQDSAQVVVSFNEDLEHEEIDKLPSLRSPGTRGIHIL